MPERKLQVDVFKSIKSKPLKDRYCEALCMRLGDDGENLAAIIASVEIMLEMGILAVNYDDMIYVPENPDKVNLEDSEIMKKIRNLL